MYSKLKMNNKNGFQSLLYVNFIIRKRYRVDTTAQNMGIHKDTLYKWIRGERPFPVDQISNLVNATRDVEYLEYFCDPCNYTPMPKIKDKSIIKMFSQMVKVMQSAINLKQDG